MTSSLGEELNNSLMVVFDELVEKRCCEHGIHNSVVANEEALKAMRKIVNDQRDAAGRAARFL